MKSTTKYQQYALSLLRCYPRAWRERYAEEAAAVLEEGPATLRTLFDLLLGLVDAHLHTDLFTERKFMLQQRLHNSQVMIFCLFILSLIPWIYSQMAQTFLWGYASLYNSLGNTTKPGLLEQTNYATLQSIVNKAGLVALLATLVGVFLFIGVAAKQAVASKRRGFTGLLLMWSLSLALIILGFLAYYVKIFHSVFYLDQLAFMLSPFLPRILIALLVWVVFIGPFCLLVGSRKASLSPQLTRLAFVPAFTITLAMGIMATVLCILAVSFLIHVPDLSGLKRSIFFDLSAVSMTLLAVLAILSCWRGVQAQRALSVA